MPTTSNFGWTTPADTDLVKDGALAIRTLGNGIDTSFVDLKGGTTGQILSKASNTDLDYTWINNDQGDITGVTAGTGISGGGTSGTVTITNSMATEITAAGDIIVGTGSGTFDNLPIGTTGQVLTADTTVSPYKVKWASASSSSGPAYSAYASANQTPASSTWTKATFNTEAFDTDSVYDTSTYRFTPNKAGYYEYNFSQLAPSTGSTYVAIYKNGSEVKTAHSPTAAPGILNNSALIYMNGSTDYVECYIYSSTGGTFSASEKWGYIDGVWIRS